MDNYTLFDKMDINAPCFVSCSFGKDSLASAIIALESGMNVKKILFCHVMFDDGISAEMPEQEEFIFNRAIPTLKERYGVDTDVVIPDVTVVDWFYRIREHGKNAGQIYGWPTFRGCWVSSKIKLKAIREWKKQNSGMLEVVGIAADEEERAQRKTVDGKMLLLYDEGITERDAAIICAEAGLLPPVYSIDRPRTGCWFCQMQRTSQLMELRAKHPDRWAKMLEMDTQSPFQFKMRGSVHDYERMFQAHDAEVAFWNYARNLSDERQETGRGDIPPPHL